MQKTEIPDNSLQAAAAGVAAADGPRFAFGRNWQRFLSHLDDQRIAEAEDSLKKMLGVESLRGKTFLDIGSGSGLFSLAAAQLEAERIFSFDYDPDSVGCTQELRRRFFPEDERWTVTRGDATNSAYITSLGSFDVVYSWGVLHHTGQMWNAVENACAAVKPGGQLWLALYNDKGWRSSYWRLIKRTYSGSPPSRPFLVGFWAAWAAAKVTVYQLLRGRPAEVFRYWTRTGGRGMTGWNDLVDWVGGYPYEVASPEQVFDFCSQRGFELERLRTTNALGCNEFVFRRSCT